MELGFLVDVSERHSNDVCFAIQQIPFGDLKLSIALHLATKTKDVIDDQWYKDYLKTMPLPVLMTKD